MTGFTPKKINEDSAIFMIRLEPCHLCQKDMVTKPEGGYDTWPHWIGNDLKAQTERAGFVFRSRIKVDDEYICTECEQKGRATFECALCGQRKPTDKIKSSFGDPPEFLCMDCYESVPAKTWEEKIKELHKQHRYDFE